METIWTRFKGVLTGTKSAPKQEDAPEEVDSAEAVQLRERIREELQQRAEHAAAYEDLQRDLFIGHLDAAKKALRTSAIGSDLAEDAFKLWSRLHAERSQELLQKLFIIAAKNAEMFTVLQTVADMNTDHSPSQLRLIERQVADWVKLHQPRVDEHGQLQTLSERVTNQSG